MDLRAVWFSCEFLFIGFTVGNQLIAAKKNGCGDVHLVQEQGIIKSPNYPQAYPSSANCTWTILAPPFSILTLLIKDLDIEEDADCESPPCCLSNSLVLPVNETDILQHYCGRNSTLDPIQFSRRETKIKFVTSSSNLKSRGFLISYRIKVFKSDECDGVGKISCGIQPVKECFDNKTQRCDGVKDCISGLDEMDCGTVTGSVRCEKECRSGGCYLDRQACDTHPHCPDFTDEINCGYCKPDEALCGKNPKHCFIPSSQLCDGIIHCPYGEDEIGCDVMPSNHHRVTEMDSDKCFPGSLWCDANYPCSKNSDQETCLRNSVISATIMGCLFCGLMLVLAVMCGLRLYTFHSQTGPNYRIQFPPHIAARLSLTHSISLPELMEDDFFRREPPPAYSVACGQSDLSVEALGTQAARRTRPRRHRPRPPVKPPTPPPSSDTSNQSSPTRDSLTSSSYLSNDDNTHLIDTRD